MGAGAFRGLRPGSRLSCDVLPRPIGVLVLRDPVDGAREPVAHADAAGANRGARPPSDGCDSSSPTSLLAGRMRDASVIDIGLDSRAGHRRSRRSRRSRARPPCRVARSGRSLRPTRRRRGSRRPCRRRTSGPGEGRARRACSCGPRSSWVMIVGITARADCRGPNVLNGRRTTAGSSYVQWKLSTTLSAPIFEAAYGDCDCSGWLSSIGTTTAVPYTSLVEVCTMRETPVSRAARATLRVPRTFVSKKSRGFSKEYGTATCAPRWKTTSTPATARRTDSKSRRSPVWTSTSSRTAGSIQSKRAAVVAGVVAVEAADPRAVAHQPLDEVATDEAPRAGDEHGAPRRSRVRSPPHALEGPAR